MNVLLISMLFAGLAQPKPHTPAIDSNQHTGSRGDKSILVVADGSRTWSGVASDAIIDRLRSDLGQSWSVRVLRFDAESSGTSELLLKGSKRDLVQVPPRMPMKDTIRIALNHRAQLDGFSAIVVIARGQLYPTYVRTDNLASALRRESLPVYTIHLTDRKHRCNLFRNIRHGFSSGVVWLTEALIEEDREVYSTEETGRMLSLLSEATGGTAYTASTRDTGLLCATKVAAIIAESSHNLKTQTTEDAAASQ